MFSGRASVRAQAIHVMKCFNRHGLVSENGSSGKPLAAR